MASLIGHPEFFKFFLSLDSSEREPFLELLRTYAERDQVATALLVSRFSSFLSP